MKKINQFALGFAIALTGALGFSACSSEENVDVNPSYNKQTGELNVDFVFNISTSNTPTTRMTSANTQATTGDYQHYTDRQELFFRYYPYCRFAHRES